MLPLPDRCSELPAFKEVDLSRAGSDGPAAAGSGLNAGIVFKFAPFFCEFKFLNFLEIKF